MELGEAILAVGAGDRAPSFELFSETLDAAWIAQALQATGTATIRRRKLPAEYVVWLVIGMALLRDRSIREVVRHLDLVQIAGTTGLFRGNLPKGPYQTFSPARTSSVGRGSRHPLWPMLPAMHLRRGRRRSRRRLGCSQHRILSPPT